MAVNKIGDVVMGFTGTWTNTFPNSTVVAGEVDSNEITIGTTLVPKAGNDTFETGSSRNRWGDYSATVVDPINPLHFWTFQEFVNDENQWATQITKIKLTPDDILGDMDFDGDLDLDDVDAFVLAHVDSNDYYDAFGAKDFVHGDLSEDGDLDLDDVEPFVEALVGGSGSGSGSGAAIDSRKVNGVPEPSGMSLLVVAVTAISIAPFRRHALRGTRAGLSARKRWFK